MPWYLGRTTRGEYEIGTRADMWDPKLGFGFKWLVGPVANRIVHRLFRKRTRKGPRAFELAKGQVKEIRDVTMRVEDIDL